jgi:hypothetical protein
MRTAATLTCVALAAVVAALAGGAPSTQAGSDTLPTFGQTMNTGLRSGDVFIRPRGEDDFHRLTGIETIPLGSSIDSTDGRMWLQTQLEDGTYESIDYYDGRFNADQDQTGLITVELEGAKFGSCENRSTRGKASKKLTRLWGNGKGKSRTKGRGGSGTVRGTIWLTEERCNGTFFKVTEGTIKVRDFGRDKSVVLDAGEKYLAEAP